MRDGNIDDESVEALENKRRRIQDEDPEVTLPGQYVRELIRNRRDGRESGELPPSTVPAPARRAPRPLPPGEFVPFVQHGDDVPIYRRRDGSPAKIPRAERHAMEVEWFHRFRQNPRGLIYREPKRFWMIVLFFALLVIAAWFFVSWVMHPTQYVPIIPKNASTGSVP